MPPSVPAGSVRPSVRSPPRPTSSPRRRRWRCSTAAATPSTRRSRPTRRSPSPPRTCAGWAATCSPSCARPTARSSASTPAAAPGRAPTPPRCAPRATPRCRCATTSASVTVPGCVDGWMLLHERFGSLDLATILAPAIRLAASGFPASPLLVALARAARRRRRGRGSTSSSSRRRQSARGCAGPAWRSPCRRSSPAVGRPSTAARSARACSRSVPGYFTEADLAASQADWVDPLRGSGVRRRAARRSARTRRATSLLGAARLAERVGVPDDPDDARWAHVLVEAASTAAFDRPDVLHDGADGAALLAAIEARADLVDLERAGSRPVAATAGRHDVPVHGRRRRDWPSA